MPRGGARGQNLDTFKKCFSTFLLWNNLGRLRSDLWVMKRKSPWPIFHSPVILPNILKTFWYKNAILWDYESIWPDVWPQNKCRSLWPVFLISWRLFDIWTPYFGIMSQYDPVFDLKINVGHWPIFHGPVILPYILKTIWCINTVIWDYESVWPDVWPQNKCRSLWPIFHGPVILPYILKTIWYMNTILWDYESVWPDVWPQNKCMSLCPIFHGPVILPCIWKTIWYMNTILWDYE